MGSRSSGSTLSGKYSGQLRAYLYFTNGQTVAHCALLRSLSRPIQRTPITLQSTVPRGTSNHGERNRQSKKRTG